MSDDYTRFDSKTWAEKLAALDTDDSGSNDIIDIPVEVEEPKRPRFQLHYSIIFLLFAGIIFVAFWGGVAYLLVTNAH